MLEKRIMPSKAENQEMASHLAKKHKLCPYCDLKTKEIEVLSYTCFKFDENTSTYKPYLVYRCETDAKCHICGKPISSAFEPYLDFKEIRLD